MIEFISDNLEQKIKQLLKESNEIRVVTAFLKKTGLTFLKDIQHKNITIITGIDFFITDPDAITYLYENDYKIRIYHEPKKVFHPKCIYIKNVKNEYLIVGSSNITFGGLNINHEVSLLINNDHYSTDLVFKNFNKYYDNLLDSHFCFDINNIIFKKYSERYKSMTTNSKEAFDSEIENEVYKNEVPISDISEMNKDDWVFHNTFGLGNVIEKNNQNIEVFFLEGGIKILIISNQIYKIFNFDSILLERYFTIENLKSFNTIIEEYKEKGKSSLDERYIFYKKWYSCLSGVMTSEEIYSFFEESSEIWTLMMLKKNILSENADKFNDYLNILRNNNMSLYKRFELACNKDDKDKIFGGIGPGITSTILSILYPDLCGVYNNASNDFLKYFNINVKKVRGKNQ